jgi:hypothetical protein
MSESSNWHRDEPSRQAPHRNGWANTNYINQVTDVAASTVEQAVKLGYQVIEDNIERGKSFAGRYTKEDHHASSSQDDLIQLSSKLIQLGRDLTLNYFDAVEKILGEIDGIRSRQKNDLKNDDPDAE